MLYTLKIITCYNSLHLQYIMHCILDLKSIEFRVSGMDGPYFLN